MNDDFPFQGKSLDPKGLVEAALFLSDGGVPRSELEDLTGLPSDSLEEVLRDLKKDFENEERGLRLIEGSQGVKLQVKQAYLPRVKHLAPHQDLSGGVLRTLSIIAYNSPVLQKEVIEVRGNGAYAHVDELVQRGFVKSQKEGRTKLLSVTEHFFDYFELEDLEDLKNYGQKAN